MRILYICKRYYTNKDLLKDRFGRLFHLPIELARNGVHVEVAAIDYWHSNREEINVDGVVFRSIPATLATLFLLPLFFYRLVLVAKPDIIVASGDSHIGFIAMLIAKKLGVPFVFDVYDYYPAFRGNKIPGMKALFRCAVESADLVLCASEPLFQKLLPLNANRLLVENGVDPILFAPSDMLQARDDLGFSSESLLVGYFGSIDFSRGPLLIEACRMLRDEFPLLHLVLAGHVVDVNLQEPWITHFGELPQAELPKMINACDLVVIPYANTPFNSMCGACKIAEYLACGKPVVATRVSSHEKLFHGASASLCDPASRSLAEAVRRQLDKPEIIPFPVYMSWEHLGRSFFDILQSVRGSSSRTMFC